MFNSTDPTSEGAFDNFANVTEVFFWQNLTTAITTSEALAAGMCPGFYNVAKDRKVSAEIELVRKITFNFLLPTIALLGVVGNTLNLFVLRSFTGRTFFYLFWLAVSDLSTMIFDSLFALGFSLTPNSFVFAFLLCHVVPSTAGMCLTCSNFLVVVLTVDRFRAVCYPIESRTGQNKSRRGPKVLLCLISAMIVFYPISYLWKVEAIELSESPALCYVCQRRKFKNYTLAGLYGVLLGIFSKIIPVLIVAVINISTVVGLSRHQTERTVSLSIGPDQRESAEDRLKVLIMTITTVFIVCLTPLAIRQMFFRQERATLEFAIFKAVSLTMIHMNTACNFYVYCFCSQAIRNRLREICSQLLKTATKSLSREPPTTPTTPSTPGTPGTPTTAISMISIDPFNTKL